jgi:hypothetical protein
MMAKLMLNKCILAALIQIPSFFVRHSGGPLAGIQFLVKIFWIPA